MLMTAVTSKPLRECGTTTVHVHLVKPRKKPSLATMSMSCRLIEVKRGELGTLSWMFHTVMGDFAKRTCSMPLHASSCYIDEERQQALM